MLPLSEADKDLAREASRLLGKNVDTLRLGTAPNKVEQHLWDWAIVLGVLAKEALDSTLLLIESNYLRAANMLSRGLTDYDIRLRYYIIQYRFEKAKFEKRGKRVQKSKMIAVKHWSNGNYKLGKTLNLYSSEVWPEEVRRALAKIGQSKDPEFSFNLSDGVKFLRKHEIEVLGINTFFRNSVELRYASSLLAEWRMQSSFLHGDQSIITDIVEVGASGQRVSKELLTAPASPRLLIHQALLHVTELLASFELLHNGASGQAALEDRMRKVWQEESPGVDGPVS